MDLQRWIRIIVANLEKDLRIWLRQWKNILAALILPCTYVAVVWLGSAAVGRSPVALVVEDQGPAAIALAQAINTSDVFRVSQVSSQQAQALYHDLEVGAIITIPSGFSQAVASHRRAPIPVQINNLNLDFTNDIRRAIPDAITMYYSQLGPANPLKITIAQHNLRPQDVEIFQFSVLPMITLLLMVSGLIASGIATAREWEDYSVKEMLLSPASPVAVIIGKVLSGSISTFSLGLVMLTIGYILDWIRPQGLFLLTSLLAIALIALFSSGLGIAMGTYLRRVQSVTSLSMTLSVWLFFLSGGVGVIQFEPDWLKRIAAFDPLTYGTHALQMAIFYQSSDRLGVDVAVLCTATLAVVLFSIRTMHMRLVQ